VATASEAISAKPTQRTNLFQADRDFCPPFLVRPARAQTKEVEVLCGGWSPKPLAKGKGVIVRWGLEEAGGKASARGTRIW
jgi:hypothetical protein